MAYSLTLSRRWITQRWNAKIRDRERLEPPHVSLLRGTRTWRLGLRSGTFLDEEPDPAEVPFELVEEVRASWVELRTAWDEMYPENPVESEDDDER
jgi:hypothetical protein